MVNLSCAIFFSKTILFPIKACFNKDSIANILYVKDASKIPGVNITTKKKKYDAIVDTSKEAKVNRFEPHRNCLFYYDTGTP